MQEKRRYVRLEKELSLTFERKGPRGILRGQAVTKNLSPKGLCLISKVPLGVGEKIILSLSLPGAPSPLLIETRVKWNRPLTTSPPSYETGMELSFPKETDQNHYLLFICDLLCEELVRQRLL